MDIPKPISFNYWFTSACKKPKVGDGLVEQIADLLDGSPCSALFFTSEGQIEYANQKAVELFGYSKEEFKTKSIFELSPYEPARILGRLSLAICTGSFYEKDIIQRSGHRIQVRVSCRVASLNGKKGYLAVVRETTKEKLGVDKAEVFNDKKMPGYCCVVLNYIQDALIVSDLDSRIRMINRAAEKLTGWTREEAIKNQLENIFQIEERQSKDLEKQFSFVHESSKTELSMVETILSTKDGKKVKIEVSFFPIALEDELSGLVLLFREIV